MLFLCSFQPMMLRCFSVVIFPALFTDVKQFVCYKHAYPKWISSLQLIFDFISKFPRKFCFCKSENVCHIRAISAETCLTRPLSYLTHFQSIKSDTSNRWSLTRAHRLVISTKQLTIVKNCFNTIWHWTLTLRSFDASAVKRMRWFLCGLAFLHVPQTSSWSSAQKKVRGSPWRLQNSTVSTGGSWVVCSLIRSHMFLSTMFMGGLGLEDTDLQMGHSWIPRRFQKVFTQPLQMLWEQGRRMGSMKMSQQMGQ